MATATKPEPKRSHSAWFNDLHAISRAAQDARQQTSQQRSVDTAMRIETDTKTKYDQLDNNNRLNDRIWVLRQWRDELKAQLRRLNGRVKHLAEAKRVHEDYMVKLADAKTVNVESLTFLDSRRNGDYVDDPVEQQLKKEQDLLDEIHKGLQSQILETFDMLRHMQDATNAFYGDIEDKDTAMRIDIDQYNLTERSGGVGYKPYATRKPKNPLDLQSWEDLSRATLERARAEVAKAGDQIHNLHYGIHQAAHRMGAQADRVADALRLRLHDMERAIRELEWQRISTEKEKDKLLKEISNLEEAKKAKQASLKLVETRLEARQDRPRNENVEDAAQIGILDELNNLHESISALDEQLDKSRAGLHRLDDQLGRLCQELHTKKDAWMIYHTIQNMRKRLETPPQTSIPPCPMIPEGIVRQPLKFN